VQEHDNRIIKILFEIWISESGIDEDSSFMGYYAVSTLRWSVVWSSPDQDRLVVSEDEDIKLFQNDTKYLPARPSKRETFGQFDDEGERSDHSKYRQLLPVDKT